MERYELRPRMLVMHQGKVARVEKINPKKIVVQHEDGARWNTYPSHLTPAPEGTTFDLEEATGLVLGSVVQWKDGTRNRMTHGGTPYVIVAVSQGGFRMAQLFGDANRYFRDVPASSLEVMDAAGLKAYLSYATV